MTARSGPTSPGHDGERPVLHLWIRDQDPRFERAVELANEVVATLAYWVMEPVGDGTVLMPTFSAALSEALADRDGVLMPMMVFALARTARNLAHALELERGCTTIEVLREFLPQAPGGSSDAT